MTKKISTDFERDLKSELKNPKFKKYFDEYGRQFEIACQILQLRKKKKISQAKLARKLGTTQSNVARMEAGRQNFSTAMLVKIAQAFDKDLEIRFV